MTYVLPADIGQRPVTIVGAGTHGRRIVSDDRRPHATRVVTDGVLDPVGTTSPARPGSIVT